MKMYKNALFKTKLKIKKKNIKKLYNKKLTG